ncbi:hypothetical protein AMECASPLE_018046, partial [Ameca splendens]
MSDITKCCLNFREENFEDGDSFETPDKAILAPTGQDSGGCNNFHIEERFQHDLVTFKLGPHCKIFARTLQKFASVYSSYPVHPPILQVTPSPPLEADTDPTAEGSSQPDRSLATHRNKLTGVKEDPLKLGELY